MRIVQVIHRLGAGAAAAALVTLSLLSNTAEAATDVCKDSYGNPVPSCLPWPFAHTFDATWGHGWALYCPSFAPYYWGSWTANWTRGGGIITENLIAEAGNLSKADFTFTNLNVLPNSVLLTIGCSPSNPNGLTCNGPMKEVNDPSCPQSSRRIVCIGDGEDMGCWSEWTEECQVAGGVQDYFCTDAAVKEQCWTCKDPSSASRPKQARSNSLQNMSRWKR